MLQKHLFDARKRQLVVLELGRVPTDSSYFTVLLLPKCAQMRGVHRCCRSLSCLIHHTRSSTRAAASGVCHQQLGALHALLLHAALHFQMLQGAQHVCSRRLSNLGRYIT
jgi:hypothetical protein